MTREESLAFEAGRRAYDRNRSLDELPATVFPSAPEQDAWRKGWQRGQEVFREHQRSAMELMARRPASRCEMSSRGPRSNEHDCGPSSC